ncbi:MAG: UDP-N-acetylmuramate dehydrogenase [Halioglobus sp.]|nr:UDP-N-acetylmuramate dehydrogenase [Halioglobus sp.]
MQLHRETPLQSYSTLALPAKASLLCTLTDAEELPQALAIARDEGRAVIPLGEGSNIVFAGDVQACLLRMASRGISVVEKDSQTVCLRVAAGENWHALVRWSVQQGFFGLQNLALIPGTVGAAPVQNIGAYGVELEHCVRQVHGVYLTDATRFVFDGHACRFGYRDSVFKSALRDRVLITAVDLVLSLRPEVDTGYPALQGWLQERGISVPSPQQVFDAVVAIRSSKLPDPASEPNAGSFFKNPLVTHQEAEELKRRHPALPVFPQSGDSAKLAAAWMIEYCGWKGHRRAGVGVHPGHALVLVNLGNGTGAQLLALAADITSSVRDSFGISLEIEPRVYGALSGPF